MHCSTTYQSMSCSTHIYHFILFFIFAVTIFRLNTKKYLEVWGGWDGNYETYYDDIHCLFSAVLQKTTQGASLEEK